MWKLLVILVAIKTKVPVSWERKGFLKWDKKHFSLFLKEFYWSKQSKFLEGKSPKLAILAICL